MYLVSQPHNLSLITDRMKSIWDAYGVDLHEIGVKCMCNNHEQVKCRADKPLALHALQVDAA